MAEHWAGKSRDDLKVFLVVYGLAALTAFLLASLASEWNVEAWSASGPIFLAAAILATAVFPKIVQARAKRR